VRARLTEAAPCPGSLMEGWFDCQVGRRGRRAPGWHRGWQAEPEASKQAAAAASAAPPVAGTEPHICPCGAAPSRAQASNNNRAACAAKKACTWTDWSLYTSLPLPSRRRLLGAAGAAAPPAGAVPTGVRGARGGPDQGGCQYAPVYALRAAKDWDGLSTLAFQISNLDPAGGCLGLGVIRARGQGLGHDDTGPGWSSGARSPPL
jgi:hypothetical protein